MSSSPAPSAREAQREAERAVRAEVRRLNELQARMLRECHAKCIAKPRDGDLAIAEMACLDRCVPKYLETHDLVGKEIDAVRPPRRRASASASTTRRARLPRGPAERGDGRRGRPRERARNTNACAHARARRQRWAAGRKCGGGGQRVRRAASARYSRSHGGRRARAPAAAP